MRLSKNARKLRPVHANAGIEAAYRRKLYALIEAMQRSYERWVRAAYRANPPAMAQDALPAAELERLLKKMGLYWSRRFEEAAPKLAAFFAQSVQRQSEAQLRSILKSAGITVKFKMTKQVRDIVRAEVVENVSLIKSIQEQYHTQVEGLVMRSVTAGRDLKQLTDDLEERYGITRRRAAFIALDQNNKSTAAIQRERQLAVGIEKGVWRHSHAGKEPRPTHLANDNQPFDLKTGWYDPDPRVKRRVWPGELIRCRCFWTPVVEGFSATGAPE